MPKVASLPPSPRNDHETLLLVPQGVHQRPTMDPYHRAENGGSAKALSHLPAQGLAAATVVICTFFRITATEAPT